MIIPEEDYASDMHYCARPLIGTYAYLPKITVDKNRQRCQKVSAVYLLRPVSEGDDIDLLYILKHT